MPPPAALKPGAPYCNNCNYDLTGATETPVCPECGKPLVDVLVRGRASVTHRNRRYRSEALLFGLPIVDIALGPTDDERLGVARGIIAIGDRATGLIAVGNQYAVGVVAFGGGAGIGVVGLGGGAGIGLYAFGGGAGVGGLALGGGGAAGAAATTGGVAAGFIAQGSLAVGYYARGAEAFGVHTISGAGAGPPSPQAQAMFDRIRWLIGTPSNPFSFLLPLAHVGGAAVLLATIILALAAFGHHRATRRSA